MQRTNQRRGAMKKWLLLAIIGAMTGVGIGGALAQVTPTTGTGTDIGTLLQQFGSLFGNGTGTGTTTTPGTTTPSTTTQPSTGGGTRQTTITDQFNSTSSSALRERSPGVWIRNAQAVQSGEQEFITGDVPVEPDNFYKATFDQIALSVINIITNLVSGLNIAAAAAGGLPPPTTTTQPSGDTTVGLTTIANPATSGAGTSVPIQ